jgi:hypothetical protein
MTAFTSSVGQMGGITSALIFPESDGPYYVPGVSVCIGLCAAGFVVAGCIWFFNSLEKKRVMLAEGTICVTFQEINRTSWVKSIQISGTLCDTGQVKGSVRPRREKLL